MQAGACQAGCEAPSSQAVKVTVYVTPKKNVLDPQGQAVAHAMESLGFKAASPVRVGKTVEFALDREDNEQTRQELDRICHDLLSNPVIEDYRYTVEAE